MGLFVGLSRFFECIISESHSLWFFFLFLLLAFICMICNLNILFYIFFCYLLNLLLIIALQIVLPPSLFNHVWYFFINIIVLYLLAVHYFWSLWFQPTLIYSWFLMTVLFLLFALFHLLFMPLLLFLYFFPSRCIKLWCYYFSGGLLCFLLFVGYGCFFWLACRLLFIWFYYFL